MTTRENMNVRELADENARLKRANDVWNERDKKHINEIESLRSEIRTLKTLIADERASARAWRKRAYAPQVVER